VANICNADVKGTEKGSNFLHFAPGRLDSSRPFLADPKTAGATTLLLQVALPTLLFEPPSSEPSAASEPVQLTLRGGTNASHAPSVDYAYHVFFPFLRRHLGLSPTLDIIKRGYYPKGGGEVRVQIPRVPGPLPAFTLAKRGPLVRIRGRAYVAGTLPILLAQKMARGARDVLLSASAVQADDVPIEIEEVKENEADAVGSGSGLFLWAETEDGFAFGGTSIGEKGKDAVKLGAAAAAELLRGIETGACVDEHLQAGGPVRP
jgi:RNA 3'-terminal phosphate cyclase (ATP)